MFGGITPVMAGAGVCELREVVNCRRLLGSISGGKGFKPALLNIWWGIRPFCVMYLKISEGWNRVGSARAMCGGSGIRGLWVGKNGCLGMLSGVKGGLVELLSTEWVESMLWPDSDLSRVEVLGVEVLDVADSGGDIMGGEDRLGVGMEVEEVDEVFRVGHTGSSLGFLLRLRTWSSGCVNVGLNTG